MCSQLERRKREKIQNINIKDKRGEVTSDFIDIGMIIGGCSEYLYNTT